MKFALKNLQKNDSLYWICWLVLVGVLFLTFTVANTTQSQIKEKSSLRFENHSKRIIHLLEERMQKYEYALWNGVAFVESTDQLDHMKWHNFTDTLDLKQRYSGLNGIGVIYYVPSDKYDGFVSKEQKDRPDFKIHPKHDKDEYWPITYIEPVETNAAAVGLDMAFETNRHKAATIARDKGIAQITGPITLVQDSQKTPGFLFYAPFYSSKNIDTPELRQKYFVGHVYAPFIMNNLLDGALFNENRLVDFSIKDGNDTLFDELNEKNADFDPNPLYKKDVTLNMYGRPWTIHIQSDLTFRNLQSNNQSIIILLGGMLIIILMIIIFIIFGQTNKRALSYAEKLTEDIIQKNNELEVTQSAIAQALEGISRIDPQGCYITLNKAYAGTAGYTPEELEGQNWSKTVHPDDMPMLEDAYAEMLEKGKVTAEARGIKKDGSLFYKRVTMICEYEDDGTFIGHYCFMQDITQRKEAEEKLQGLASLNNAILDSAKHLIIATDVNGKVTLFNKSAQEILGYTADEVIGKQTPALWHDMQEIVDRAALLTQELGTTITPGFDVFTSKANTYGIDTSDWTLISKNKTRIPVHLTVTCLKKGKDIIGYLSVLEDVSERKQQEEMKQRFIDQLTESNTELERFAYIASHDMQEPIRMVTNFSQILTDDYADKLDSTAQEYLKFINNGGQRLNALIDDLLSYSRVENMGTQMVVFEGNAIVKNVLENLYELINEKNAQITSDDMPKLFGNPVQIMRLIQNLVINGIKYQVEERTSEIHIGIKDEDDSWILSVKDNGLGLRPEFIEQIFMPFRRLHTWDNIQGTGLGLPICKKIVQSHGGKIWVESTPEKGSVFFFSILKQGINSTKESEVA